MLKVSDHVYRADNRRSHASQRNLEQGQGRDSIGLPTAHNGAQMSIQADALREGYLRAQDRSFIKTPTLAPTIGGKIIGRSKLYSLKRHVHHLRDWTSTSEYGGHGCLRGRVLSLRLIFLFGPLHFFFREGLPLLCVYPIARTQQDGKRDQSNESEYMSIVLHL